MNIIWCLVNIKIHTGGLMSAFKNLFCSLSIALLFSVSSIAQTKDIIKGELEQVFLGWKDLVVEDLKDNESIKWKEIPESLSGHSLQEIVHSLVGELNIVYKSDAADSTVSLAGYELIELIAF